MNKPAVFVTRHLRIAFAGVGLVKVSIPGELQPDGSDFTYPETAPFQVEVYFSVHPPYKTVRLEGENAERFIREYDAWIEGGAG